MSTNAKLTRYRAFHRAAVAWRAGYPHQAWEIITEAGYGNHYAQFVRECLHQARQDYQVAIERYFV